MDAARQDSPQCYHCGLPVPDTAAYAVEIDGSPRAMCCRGCQAVAQAIVDGGLTDFYRYRTATPQSARELVPEALRQTALYDRPEVQRSFVRNVDGDLREASLILEGITCAACVWLNEQHVNALPGVHEFRVNYSTRRARLRWDDRVIHLSDVLKAITAIGYVAHPFDADRQEALYRTERRAALKRLAVAGVGMMQVMMLAVALYAGEYQGMEGGMESFLRWVSFLVATPVVVYAGQTFFVNAWRDLANWRAGMDVPVALAIGSTYLASGWATVTHSGQVYFESVTMFVFFLLTGRFLEMSARHRAGQATEELGRLLPATATRVGAEGDEVVSIAELRVADHVRVRPGETIPADGQVLTGVSSVDESLMSGESLPCAKQPGDEVIAGTVNTESPLLIRVMKLGDDTALSAIQRLLDRAQTEKPRLARLAETGTGWFVAAVLVLTALVGFAWYQIRPEDAFWIMLAMLVVSCPCALALATPVAITAATGHLTRLGALTTRGHALETLAQATHVVFDKTGTLTAGRPVLDETVVYGALSAPQAVAVAAALEATSEHPIANAFAMAARNAAAADEVTSTPGHGVEGLVDGERYRLGSAAFVAEFVADSTAVAERAAELGRRRPDASVAFLGHAQGLLAAFVLADRLRPEAREVVAALRTEGMEVWLLSGDGAAPVRRAAEQLGIANFRAELTPQGKLEQLEALQAQGAVVAMVGDGVNDAPVLSRAHVSVAMAGGTQLAQASADMVLFSDRLSHLLAARRKAGDTVRIIRQNIYWAVGYNALALPIAAAGLLTPWLAALGMSVSSLLVVLNALRLSDPGQARRPRADKQTQVAARATV